MAESKFSCPKCGQHLEADDSIRGQTVVCPSCNTQFVAPAAGAAPAAAPRAAAAAPAGGKTWIATLLLCLFLGNLGVHRFYTGHTGIGVAQLLTVGGVRNLDAGGLHHDPHGVVQGCPGQPAGQGLKPAGGGPAPRSRRWRPRRWWRAPSRRPRLIPPAAYASCARSPAGTVPGAE